jgi:hypothetical protein
VAGPACFGASGGRAGGPARTPDAVLHLQAIVSALDSLTMCVLYQLSLAVLISYRAHTSRQCPGPAALLRHTFHQHPCGYLCDWDLYFERCMAMVHVLATCSRIVRSQVLQPVRC